jgi:Na+-driven multidrug efflux pump
LPLEAARYIIPLAAGVSSLVAYVLGQPDPLSAEAIAVAGVNLASLLYIAVLSIHFRRSLVIYLQGRRISTGEGERAA